MSCRRRLPIVPAFPHRLAGAAPDPSSVTWLGLPCPDDIPLFNMLPDCWLDHRPRPCCLLGSYRAVCCVPAVLFVGLLPCCLLDDAPGGPSPTLAGIDPTRTALPRRHSGKNTNDRRASGASHSGRSIPPTPSTGNAADNTLMAAGNTGSSGQHSDGGGQH